MKNRKWFTVIIVIALALPGIVSISAQDWPQWRGANRDGKVDNFTAPESWPPELSLQWRDSIGTGDATPVLMGDKLYVFTRQGDQEILLCLEADRGEEQWRMEYAAPAVTGAGSRHPGPRSTPVVSGNMILTLGASGILSCVERTDGKLLWHKDPFPGVVPMFFTAMSPMIIDGLGIAHLGGIENGAIIAYDMKTGDEKWRWSEEGPDYGSPVLLEVDGTKQLVTLTEKSIVGVDLSNGEELWKLPFPPQRRAYNAATPIVDGNVVIFTGAGRGTKAVKIEKKEEAFVPNELWANTDLAVQFNTPVLKKDLLFGYSNTGSLFCLDALTGQTAWTDTIKHDRGGFASLLDVGPYIAALPSSSELIFIKPEKEAYTELAKIKVADLPTYATPVFAGNRIYIRDETTVSMWKIQ